MRARQTIKVRELGVAVNLAIRTGEHGTAEFRRGQASVLEQVLHMTGQYRGFAYTDPDAERNGEGYLVEGGYDDSQRVYILPPVPGE